MRLKMIFDEAFEKARQERDRAKGGRVKDTIILAGFVIATFVMIETGFAKYVLWELVKACFGQSPN